MDVWIFFRDESQHSHRSLTTLRIAGIKKHIVPLIAHRLQQLSGSDERIDAGLGIDTTDAISLLLVLRNTKTVIICRDGDKSAPRNHLVYSEIASRRALIGPIDCVVIIEQHTASRYILRHLIADSDHP